MRSKLLGQVIALTMGLGMSGALMAQPKNKNKSSEVGSDKTIDKQSAWEQKVMGEDSAKKSDLRKIAAAQKLADEARKNPPPIAAPKVKDPSKEGARAKQEASIGLPIASDEATRTTKKASAGNGNASRKATAPSSSANDELGSLVASSLAADKVAASGSPSSPAGDSPSVGRSGNRAKGAARHRAKGGARAKSGGGGVADGAGTGGSLDQLFAAGK